MKKYILAVAIWSLPTLVCAATISPTGIDGITLGMSEKDVSASGIKFVYDSPVKDEETGKSCVTGTSEEKHVSIMLDGGHVIRIDIANPIYKTTSPWGSSNWPSISVGVSQKQVIAAYEQMTISPAANLKQDYYLDFKNAEDNAIRFTITKGIVSTISIGTPESIKFIEGCL